MKLNTSILAGSFTGLLALFASCSGGGSDLGQPGPGKDDNTKKSTKSGVLGEIAVINKSPHEGVSVAEVVVPLEEGAYTEAPRVRTETDQVCQVFAMGPRFDDGSLRYLRLEVPVSAAADDLQTVKLSTTNDPDPDFTLHAKAKTLKAWLQASGDTVRFEGDTVIEGGPVTTTFRSRLRIPDSMFWAELTIMFYSGLPHAKFTLQWGNSDARTEALSEDPGEVALRILGPRVEIEYAEAKVLARTGDGDETKIVLHKSGKIADGQSQLVEGRFIFDGASPPRLYAISNAWQRTGTFGPFGDLLPDIKVREDEFDALVLENEHKHKDHPWAWPVHGCNPSPSSTGSQNDFGSVKMRADVLLASPKRLRTILRSVYQEACRTTHHRELDVSRVRGANHPRLLTLSGRPKYEGKNPDMLGKRPNVWIKDMMRSPEGQRWKGHDSQHLSINYLAGIALLTGNRFAREEIDHHCELYLTGFTYKSGTYNDSPGASRQVGRTSLAGIWMWLVSGREEVGTRVANRVKDLHERLATQNLPFDVIKPRVGSTKWYTWEEGNGVTGLYAVYRNFGSAEALDLVHRISRSVVMHGYGKRKKDGSWRLGYQLPFLDGNGKTYVARNDPDFDSKAAGGGLTTWGIPAVFIAAVIHPDADVREQAIEIVEDRHGGPTNGLEEDIEWVCVNAQAATVSKMTSDH